MEIEQHEQDGVTVFSLAGRLDGEATETFASSVSECLKQGARQLVFDCSRLEYINSSGLRVLVMAYQRLAGSRDGIAVCALRDYIREIFDITGYDQIFAMHQDCSAAVRAMIGLR
jgi:anti-sigma B factor antagonist